MAERFEEALPSPVPGDTSGGPAVALLGPRHGRGPRALLRAVLARRAGVVQAGPLAVAGFLANGAGVVVTVVVARLLTTRGYGSLNQLNGLFLVVSTPGSAVTVAVVRRVASWSSSGATPAVRQWGQRARRRGALLLAGVLCAVAVSAPWLARLLGQVHVLALVLMLAAAMVWVLLNVDRGLLQGGRRYGVLSVNLLVEGAARTVLVLVLVGTGLGVDGAACGMLVAELVTAAHARRHADASWSAVAAVSVGTGPGPVQGGGGRRTLVADLVTALLSLATIAWLQNVDVIVIGREGPSVAGAYAAVSIASKALVFAALVLGGYLLPEAAIRWRQGRHALAQLGLALALLAIPASVLLFVAVAAPGPVLSAVFSSRYLGAEPAFVPLVLAMVCLGTTVLLTVYLLAVGRRRVAGLLLAGAGAATAAIAAAHGSAVATARADLVAQAALVLAVVGEVALVHRRRPGAGR